MGENAQNISKLPHNLILENRRALSISGVKEVRSFDDEAVVLKTELGELSIKGQNFHINHLDKESGELRIDGEIGEMLYSNRDIEPKSFWAKLLR